LELPVDDEILKDSDDARWLQRHVDFLVIPMVDHDGVEAGDQGKNRMPRDHTADFTSEIPYAQVRGVEVNPDSARALGHDIARALCAYLKTLP
jgi:hypothetical protein